MYLFGDGFLEGEGHVEKLFVVDIFLLGLEVEDIEVGYIFELDLADISHGTNIYIYKRRRSIESI